MKKNILSFILLGLISQTGLSMPNWKNEDGTLNIQKLLESYKPQRQSHGLSNEFFEETLHNNRRPYRVRSYQENYDSWSAQNDNSLLTNIIATPNSSARVQEFLFHKYFLPIETMIETRWITLTQEQRAVFQELRRNPHLITMVLFEAEAERTLNQQRHRTLSADQAESVLQLNQSLRRQDQQTYDLLKNVIAEQITKLSFSDFNGTYFKDFRVQYLQMPSLNAIALIEKAKKSPSYLTQLTDLRKTCGSILLR